MHVRVRVRVCLRQRVHVIAYHNVLSGSRTYARTYLLTYLLTYHNVLEVVGASRLIHGDRRKALHRVIKLIERDRHLRMRMYMLSD